jgi:hypothetical protein
VSFYLRLSVFICGQNPFARPKLVPFGRKGNYGYYQADTGEPA